MPTSYIQHYIHAQNQDHFNQLICFHMKKAANFVFKDDSTMEYISFIEFLFIQ